MQYTLTEGLLRNILVTIKYSGLNYHGWQVQKNSVSVQEIFQNALYKVVEPGIDIKGCSRTDTGVHANMYCINFNTKRSISCDRIVGALNKFLPQDIAAINCKEVDENFHARYSCKGKEYLYKIWNHKIRDPFMLGQVYHYWYRIDDKFLNEAAKGYVGKHNFKSFCTVDKRRSDNLERTVYSFDIVRNEDMVEVRMSADGFLYNMARIMVGTLLYIQQGKFSPEDISKIILAKDRSKAGPTAQACGLYLNKVFY